MKWRGYHRGHSSQFLEQLQPHLQLVCEVFNQQLLFAQSAVLFLPHTPACRVSSLQIKFCFISLARKKKGGGGGVLRIHDKFLNSLQKKSGEGSKNIVEIADISSNDHKTPPKVIVNAKKYLMPLINKSALIYIANLWRFIQNSHFYLRFWPLIEVFHHSDDTTFHIEPLLKHIVPTRALNGTICPA